MMGTGFLYTNKDSLTIGVGCMLSDFKAEPEPHQPYALLEKMKATRHRPADRGRRDEGVLRPPDPRRRLPRGAQVYGNGWMIVGDSGGFVNAAREGSNLAMTTGRLAAETVIAAKAAGRYRAGS
jgi:electron transfer flavoprotein-quinone oxidoreductase